MRKPLRYSISDWDQVTKCLSNSSRKLSMKYAQISDDSFSGEVIKVVHEDYGDLFAYTINADSRYLFKNRYGMYNMLTTNEILEELEKYGFFIQFEDFPHISKAQIEYLKSVENLGFSKIRILGIPREDGTIMKKAVAFKPEHLNNWLINTYICSMKEFTEAMTNGYAYILDHDVAMDFEECIFDWSFLDGYIFNITDIIYDSYNYDDEEDGDDCCYGNCHGHHHGHHHKHHHCHKHTDMDVPDDSDDDSDDEEPTEPVETEVPETPVEGEETPEPPIDDDTTDTDIYEGIDLGAEELED